jgi:DNA-binding transcriptional ArsR family regulator
MDITEALHDHGTNKELEETLARLETIQDFETISDLFKQLSDGSRVRIFWLLCHCEECVINISALVGMSSPAVSHHLRQLKASGLITSRREGKEVYYTASQTKEAQLLHVFIEQIMEVACPVQE